MIKVREVDNQLYVSEYNQTPGKTDVKNYPVEYQRQRADTLSKVLLTIFKSKSINESINERG